MAKEILKIVIGGAQVVGKAFSRALRREIEQSQQAARARSSAGGSAADQHRGAANDTLTGISLQEAKQILNITDEKDKEELLQKYEHLFNVNEKSKGGSLYLQSKIVRAKERIDQELGSSGDTKQDEKTQDPEKT